jgi:hypothetical protein
MKVIPFTQFMLMRPNGRRVSVAYPCDDEVWEKSKQIIAAGFRFEAEVLMSGIVSLTISTDEDDLAFELSENGPAIDQAVKRLVMEFKL